MVIRPLNRAEEKGTGLAYGRPPLLSYPKTNYASTKGTSEIETPKSPPPPNNLLFHFKKCRDRSQNPVGLPEPYLWISAVLILNVIGAVKYFIVFSGFKVLNLALAVGRS